ncbi:MAG: hypothetical protein AAF125_26895, partial [Chloroflexota bacterium]
KTAQLLMQAALPDNLTPDIYPIIGLDNPNQTTLIKRLIADGAFLQPKPGKLSVQPLIRDIARSEFKTFNIITHNQLQITLGDYYLSQNHYALAVYHYLQGDDITKAINHAEQAALSLYTLRFRDDLLRLALLFDTDDAVPILRLRAALVALDFAK